MKDRRIAPLALAVSAFGAALAIGCSEDAPAPQSQSDVGSETDAALDTQPAAEPDMPPPGETTDAAAPDAASDAARVPDTVTDTVTDAVPVPDAALVSPNPPTSA